MKTRPLGKNTINRKVTFHFMASVLNTLYLGESFFKRHSIRMTNLHSGIQRSIMVFRPKDALKRRHINNVICALLLSTLRYKRRNMR